MKQHVQIWSNRAGAAVGRAVRDDSGVTALVVALLMVALMGVAALTVDVGSMYAERRQLQTAADAAVLAGVLELPANPNSAVQVATEYLNLNTTRVDDVAITVSSTWATNDTITAVIRDTDKELFFAQVLGQDTAEIGAHATAMVGSPTSYAGVLPFGVMAQGTTTAPYGYSTGQEVTLVCDTGDQVSGNWQYVDLLPYSTATNTKGVIDNGGTDSPISLGAIIKTQPGSADNPNYTAVSNLLATYCAPHSINSVYRDPTTGIYEPKHLDGTTCRRLITVPIITINSGDPYNWLSVKGSSVDVKVVGFVNMFISNNPTFKDGALKATFIQVASPNAGEPGAVRPFGGLVTWLKD